MKELEPEEYSAESLRIDPSSINEPAELDELVPLRRVWALVLTVAVVDYLVAKPSSKRFADAKDWIFYGEVEAVNSFDNIARFLAFDPVRLRNAIACRRSEAWADPQKPITLLAQIRAAGGEPENG